MFKMQKPKRLREIRNLQSILSGRGSQDSFSPTSENVKKEDGKSKNEKAEEKHPLKGKSMTTDPAKDDRKSFINHTKQLAKT